MHSITTYVQNCDYVINLK